jgi:hypothetical protein
MLVACLGLSAAWAEEFPLSWQDVSRDELASGSSPVLRRAPLFAKPLAGKPGTVTALPEGVGGQASYFSISLGGQEYVLVIDNASPAKLYVDTDGDGDLAEETPFPLPAAHPGQPEDPRAWYLGPMEFKVAGQAPASAIKAWAWVLPTTPTSRVYLYPARCRSGKVKFGDRDCTVVLIDANYNGAYNDFFSLPVKSLELLGDTFEVDLNGDGQFSMSLEPPVFEVLYLPRMVEVDGAYYSIEVPADGVNLRVERVEPKTGKLAVGGAEADVLLVSESGFHPLKSTSAPWTLPAGRYLPFRMLLKRADAQGVVWSLPVVVPDPAKAPLVEVAEGRTTTLALAPPTQARVEVQAAGDSLSFDFTMEGPAGLTYSAAVQKDGKQASAPMFEVTDDSGKVVLADAFQYG